MLLATFMFAGMHTAIRYSTQQLPPVEAAFFRNVFGLVVILRCWCAMGGASSTPSGLHCTSSAPCSTSCRCSPSSSACR